MAFRLQSTGKDDVKRDRIGTRKPRVRFINDRNPFRFALVAFISLVLWRKLRVSRAVLDRDVAMVRLPDHAHLANPIDEQSGLIAYIKSIGSLWSIATARVNST